MGNEKNGSVLLEGEERCLISYFKDLEDVPLLTPEEEITLARRIRDGDEQSIDELTEANLRFVINVAKQFRNHGLSLSDLINEGNIGLIIAANRFDIDKGCRFITYAIWWIRQSILQAIAEKSNLIRQPISRSIRLKRKQKLEELYHQRMKQHHPIERFTLDEEEFQKLLESENISKKEFEDISDIRETTYISLDAPFSDSAETSTIDMLEDTNILSPEAAFIDEERDKEVEKLIDALNEKEREIIILYFGLRGSKPHTLEDIGQKLGLTRERIRQIKEQALEHLRLSEETEKLRVFIEE